VANSVSKINIVVGASTGQLQAGMNQAAATVNRGMGSIQSVAQNATYAVDDFFAAFATGGFAGGLRGAGNNLTAIAAAIGGIKAQLAIVAGLAVGQLLIKQFGGASDAAEKLKEQIDRVAGAQKQLRDLRESSRSAVEDIFREGGGQSSADASKRLNDIRRDLQASSGRLAGLQADRQATADRYIPGTQEGNEEVASQFRKIRDEELRDLDDRIAAETKINTLLTAQETAQTGVARQARKAAEEAKTASDAVQLQIDQQKLEGAFITREMRGAMATELLRIDEQIEGIKNSSRPSLSLADMFKMMPQANTMGSAGAISAINAAMIGPANAQSAGTALERRQADDIKRLRELEERKKGLVEAFAL
jgi:hypothetical protein